MRRTTRVEALRPWLLAAIASPVVVIWIGHNYRVLIVRPAHRRPKQVAPAHQITDRVTFDQVAALPVDEGGERNRG